MLLPIVAKYYLSPRALRLELRNIRRWRLRTRYDGQPKGSPDTFEIVPATTEFLSRAGAGR